MKANKSFINAKGQRVNKGDSIKESDYPKPIWNQYLNNGIIGADEKKPAKPKVKKAKK